MGLVGQVGYSISPALLKEFATNERNFHFSIGENLTLSPLNVYPFTWRMQWNFSTTAPLNCAYTKRDIIKVTVVEQLNTK